MQDWRIGILSPLTGQVFPIMGKALNSNLDEGYNFGSICKVQIKIFIVELMDSKKFGMVNSVLVRTSHTPITQNTGSFRWLPKLRYFHGEEEFHYIFVRWERWFVKWRRRGDTWLTILNSPSPEPRLARLTSLLIYVATTLWAWRFYNWAWVTPKRIEKSLREQGFDGNPYRFLVGDLKEAHSKSIGIDDDTIPRVYPIVHKSIKKYGNFGPIFVCI